MVQIEAEIYSLNFQDPTTNISTTKRFKVEKENAESSLKLAIFAEKSSKLG